MKRRAALAVVLLAACAENASTSQVDGGARDAAEVAADVAALDASPNDAAPADAVADATSSDALADVAPDVVADVAPVDASEDVAAPDAADDVASLDAPADTVAADVSPDAPSPDAPSLDAPDASPADAPDASPDAPVDASAPDAPAPDASPDAPFDCRPLGPSACPAPQVCDYLTGLCADPATACRVAGAPVPCGTGGNVIRCGAGAACDVATGRCVASSGCTRLVCDAENVCHGVSCPSAGGPVRGVTIDPVTVGAVGATGGLRVTARVDAASLCGLSVTVQVRGDRDVYLTAGDDAALWRVPLGGAPSIYVRETSELSGIVADNDGVIYYGLLREGTIKRVRPGASTPVAETLAASVGTVGLLSRLTLGPDGAIYAARGRDAFRVGLDGTVTRVAHATHVPSPARPDNTYRWDLATGIDQYSLLTGVTFDQSGALLLAEPWPWVYRATASASGAVTEASPLLDGTPLDLPTTLYNPWTEDVEFGPDGALYAAFFPGQEDAGFLYRFPAPIGPTTRPELLVRLADLRAAVPSTRFAGLHGLGFGADGTLYFTNQNTDFVTLGPTGQLLARRPSGAIEQVATGFRFDIDYGFDGDVVVAQDVFSDATAAVDGTGRAAVSLDVPARAGVYQVRVLVTDPRDGSIHDARQAVTVR